jgi:hypothetical protein
MKSLGLLVASLLLLFFVACGGVGPANPGTGASGFSNASFSGAYIFTMNGECLACTSIVSMHSVGRLVSDGNGNITSGNWDLNLGGAEQATPLTGSYSVSADGKVAVTLNETSLGASDSFVMMLTNTTGGYIVSADSAWALSGVVEAQGAIPSVIPNTQYVFQASGLDSGLRAQGIVGTMVLQTNNAPGLTVDADMNNNGALISLGTGLLSPTITSLYDSTTGRGVLTINSTSSLPTMSFAYYFVDSNTIELVSNDTGNGMQGRAEASTALTSGSVLSGSFAFLGVGFPVSGIIQVNEAGMFTGDGAGNITGGTIDSIFDNSSSFDTPLTGTGSVSNVNNATRDSLTLSAAGSTVSMTSANLWMVNASRGFFLTTSNDRAETGVVNLQSGNPFTHSGVYGFYTSGWAISGGTQGFNSATLFNTSAGKVSGYSQEVNVGGAASFGTGPGALTFDGTKTLGSLTLNESPIGGAETFRIYQYSATNAFIMETDGGIVAAGEMATQVAQ